MEEIGLNRKYQSVLYFIKGKYYFEKFLFHIQIHVCMYTNVN